ncbi:hypothetical protein QBC35DRAFT_470395 [Podospora australis]|uniref:Uncharacterized protein n=1 Tax=Podospora australis TaxID=1536484 RepID=A0AAN6X3D3_9PEZI|nr:hypothetical protein QBC35DRAFT_470395 [Podospora australis]
MVELSTPVVVVELGSGTNKCLRPDFINDGDGGEGLPWIAERPVVPRSSLSGLGRKMVPDSFFKRRISLAIRPASSADTVRSEDVGAYSIIRTEGQDLHVRSADATHSQLTVVRVILRCTPSRAFSWHFQNQRQDQRRLWKERCMQKPGKTERGCCAIMQVYKTSAGGMVGSRTSSYSAAFLACTRSFGSQSARALKGKGANCTDRSSISLHLSLGANGSGISPPSTTQNRQTCGFPHHLNHHLDIATPAIAVVWAGSAKSLDVDGVQGPKVCPYPKDARGMMGLPVPSYHLQLTDENCLTLG